MEERDEEQAPTVSGNKFWDRVKDSRLFAGLLTGLFTVLVGIVGAVIMYLIGIKEERSRTFDLLSSREVAANALQVQVFDIFVQHVVPALEKDVDDHIKVALLAGLHSNFSEIFDTRPVFEAFAETITEPGARHELRRLAKRVARHQAEYIKVHVPNPKNAIMSTVETLSWPHYTEKIFCLKDHDVTLAILRPRRYYTIEKSDSIKKDKRFRAFEEEGDKLIDDVSDIVAIKVEFTERKKVNLSRKCGVKRTEKGMTVGPFEFDLSYMDTPYMDNIWMRHGDDSHHQIALRLIDIDTTINKDTKEEEYSVTIEILHFPSNVYAATQRLPVKELLEGGHKHQ